MDRFLDEHEGLATLDRAGLSAVTVGDSEQVSGQQQVSDLPVDNSKSSSQADTDREPVMLHERGDANSHVSNGESLTDTPSDNLVALSTSDMSAGKAAGDDMADSVSVTLCADTDTDVCHADAATAEANLQFHDSCVNSSSSSSEAGKSASVLPCLVPVYHDEQLSNSHTKQELEIDKVSTASSAAAAALEEEQPISDVDGVITQPEAAASTSSATVVTVKHEQQHFGDNVTICDSHCAPDCEIPSNHAASTSDAELSAGTVVNESQANIGSAAAADVDVMRPDDVELLLPAVDSSTSASDSLHSNVDPLAAAVEHSSVDISVDLLSNKTCTSTASQQTDSYTHSDILSSSRGTDGPPSQSSLLLQSTNALKLPPDSSTGVLAATSCLPASCSDASSADALKHNVESDVCKSVSTTPGETCRAEKDMEISVDEPLPPVSLTPTSSSDMSAADQDVLLPDDCLSGTRPQVVHCQVAASSMDSESNTVELHDQMGTVRSPKENELALSNPDHLTESHLQSDISASVSDADVSSMQADCTDALHVTSIKTSSGSVSLELTSTDVLSDKLGDQPDSLDEAGQSDIRSLLTVSSDANCSSTAS